MMDDDKKKYIRPIEEYPLTLDGLEAFCEDKMLWHLAVSREMRDEGDEGIFMAHAGAYDVVLCFIRRRTRSHIDEHVVYSFLDRER